MSKKVSIAHFLSNDFREFSTYDCETNIPSMVDGLKVSQRKVMWTVLNNPKTMTVEQLASLVASYTKYHHGAVSLADAIVGLAKNFTGSNNVNWLVPDGQFGNILCHMPSSSRYISTKLHENWYQWFHKDDNNILEFEIEDAEITEPKYFIPVAPTILLNGVAGTGTGYATDIFMYKPADVVENVKRAIRGKKLNDLVPWCNGYKGKIEKHDGQTVYYGCFERVNTTTIKITQLPIGYDIEKYKEILIKLVNTGEIKDFYSDSTEENWDITVIAAREWVKQSDDDLMVKLKLITRDTETFVVWDENKRIKRFSGPNELITHFVQWRLTKYEERRIKLMEITAEELAWLKEKLKFIQYFIANSNKLTKMNKGELETLFTSLGFVNIDRLLQIRLYNLSKDEIDILETQIDWQEEYLSKLQQTNQEEMYLADIKKVKV